MNEEYPIHVQDNGLINVGRWTLSMADIKKLESFIAHSDWLNDAGFDVNVAEVGIGCKQFSYSWVLEMIENIKVAYDEYEAERKAGFELRRGDRIFNIISSQTYLITCIDHKWMIINIATGMPLDGPMHHEDHKVPARLLLGSNLVNWRKLDDSSISD